MKLLINNKSVEIDFSTRDAALATKARVIELVQQESTGTLLAERHHAESAWISVTRNFPFFERAFWNAVNLE